ncbi:APC family permease [Caproiciproducens galactitolivorans]|uniref:APC family permease n=1 Tax=Caproiciproducens galactitolivorans TaxID=642589 RepID=A0ABT4BPH3_9FIRM|nr:APC family permease [Caproiciproducens galactitolivorans]MCY1712789.1 APC family permease [Caproiciproducens galactitolivorans]
MFKKMKTIVIGKAIKSAESESEKFSVIWGLPVLSSDAISSVSYACEEILMVLVPVLGIASYKPLMGIAAAIVGLLLILVFSYRQTIECYPHGGGSYSVASDNLGKVPGLVAAASLSIDYVLTVAVSTCSGTAAITSAFPQTIPFRVEITLFLILLLTLGNLRGIRESSILFGIPTYLFIFSIIAMIATGLIKVFVFGQVPQPTTALPPQAQDVTILLLLKAFSSGCTALTGVEAVSNGIPNFKAPSQKNAKRVLALLALLVFVIFSGVCYLASMYKVAHAENVTVVSQIASRVFGSGTIMYFTVQATTAMILIMAANTAFADLPLLLSLLAKDGFVARSFGSRGARLSFSNGIMLLFLLSSVLVIVFKAETHLLIPLYAVGVFLSFTLSQTGMLKKWITHRQGNWRHKAVINGFGALMTAVTCVIIAVSKFASGAWIVLICIPSLVAFMLFIRKHYNKVRDNLSIEDSSSDLILENPTENYILLPVQSVNKSFVKALNYAMTLGKKIEVYHVSTNKAETERLKVKFGQLGLDFPLLIEEAPYRNINETLLAHVDKEQARLNKHEMLTVVLPQFVIPKRWHYMLHNQTSLRLKSALVRRRDVAVVTIPYIINE